MKFGNHRLVYGLAAWESVVLVPIAVRILSTGGKVGRDDVRFLGPALLFGVVIVAICSALAPKLRRVPSVLVCAIAGGIIFAGCSYLWTMGCVYVWALGCHGFEFPAVFLWTYLLFYSIPSAIGSGIVGWLYGRPEEQVARIP